MRVAIYNRWLSRLGGGEKHSLAIAKCIADSHLVVIITHNSVSKDALFERTGLDLSKVEFQVIPKRSPLELSELTQQYDLFINASYMDYIIPQASRSVMMVYFPIPSERNLAIRLKRWVGLKLKKWLIEPQLDDRENCSPSQLLPTHFKLKHLRYRLYQLVFEQWFKEWGFRLQNIPPGPVLEVVNKYDAIWAISKFTQKWIKKYWGCHSAVLYPPVDIERFKPAQKRNQILSVGRFFAGSHNKKQLEMVQAFRRMVDEGLVGWELHLAGGTAPERIHQEYLQQVKNLAEGYPIVIHTDLPFEQLAQLYAESAIYWHAAGLGEDENREPIKLEHFGITTVEAMAAGCVPVVIGKGGQTEIVQHGHNGFLWHSLRELIEFTWLLIREPGLRQRMANLAVIAASNYDMDHFCRRLKDLLLQLGVDI